MEEDINLRAVIWDIMCNIVGPKDECVKHHETERLRREQAKLNGDEDDDAYERDIIKDWCPQFVDPDTDTYNKDNGGRYLVEDYVKYLKTPLPKIDSPEEFYCHLKDQHTPRIKYDIRKDIKRNDTLFRDFDDFESEASVGLYNVLNAYAHYDPGVGYV